MTDNTMTDNTITSENLMEKLADAAKQLSEEQLEKLILVTEGMRLGQRETVDMAR